MHNCIIRKAILSIDKDLQRDCWSLPISTLHGQSVEMILKLLDSWDNYKVFLVNIFIDLFWMLTLFSMLIGILRLSIALTLKGNMPMVKINQSFFCFSKNFLVVWDRNKNKNGFKERILGNSYTQRDGLATKTEYQKDKQLWGSLLATQRWFLLQTGDGINFIIVISLEMKVRNVH